jgi:hypothetical protein
MLIKIKCTSVSMPYDMKLTVASRKESMLFQISVLKRPGRKWFESCSRHLYNKRYPLIIYDLYALVSVYVVPFIIFHSLVRSLLHSMCVNS